MKFKKIKWFNKFKAQKQRLNQGKQLSLFWTNLIQNHQKKRKTRDSKRQCKNYSLKNNYK